MESAPTPFDFLGVSVFPGLLESGEQEHLLGEIQNVLAMAPLRAQTGPGGRMMSVRMSAAGGFGWLTDGGYHYSPHQPDGDPWPVIPPTAVDVWHLVSGSRRRPESCLVNFYDEDARMGLHQDRDEASFDWPVVSISLGDDALFRVGGTSRRDPTRSIWLRSGDVCVLKGASRLAYHGIDRIRFRSSALLAEGGRINLTLRVVT